MTERKEEYWSQFASTYDEDQVFIVGQQVRSAIIEKLSEERDLGEVIELGCGRGYFTKAIAKNATQVLATDLSDEMVEEARAELREFHNVTVQKAACEHTIFPPETFDTVVMVNVVHFIENPDQCLLESYRILKSGGLLILVDYTGSGMKRFDVLKTGMRFFMKWGRPLRHFQKALSSDDLSNLMEGAGFIVEEAQLLGAQLKACFLKGRKP